MTSPTPNGPVAPDVAALAAAAGLPLSAPRLAAVSAVLTAWLPDANALSRKMSDAAYRDLAPITAFMQAHEGAAEQP